MTVLGTGLILSPTLFPSCAARARVPFGPRPRNALALDVGLGSFTPVQKRNEPRVLLVRVVVGKPVPDTRAPRHREASFAELGSELLQEDAFAAVEGARVDADVGLAAPGRVGAGE